MYSIIYELLNNIVKHSGASNALLQVAEYDDAFTLLVEDDGAGFYVDQQDQKKVLEWQAYNQRLIILKAPLHWIKTSPKD